MDVEELLRNYPIYIFILIFSFIFIFIFSFYFSWHTPVATLVTRGNISSCERSNDPISVATLATPGNIPSSERSNDPIFDIDAGLSRGPPLSRIFSRIFSSSIIFAGLPPFPTEISNPWELEKKRLKRKNKELEDVKSLEHKNKELEDVKEKHASLTSAVELRQILSDFLESAAYKRVEKDLMKEVVRKFREKFPGETTAQTFKGTIRKLLEAKKEAVLLDKLLNCMREASESFRPASMPWWDEKIGKVFYILCYEVVLWNKSIFHPEIEGERKQSCMNKACEGWYTVDGNDVGPFVKEALQSSSSPGTT